MGERHPGEPDGGEHTADRERNLGTDALADGPTIGATSSITRPPGAISSPASVALRPRPTSPLVGSSASCGISTKVPNRPKPTSTVAKLVIRTGGRESVVMLISGAVWRRSKNTNAVRMSRPSAKRPSVLSEVQPQSLARETAISTADSPAAKITAPTMSTRPGVRSGDSGTKRMVVIVAIAPIAAEIQKIQ